MPIIVIHGIGSHDPGHFRTLFSHVRDQLRASVARYHSYDLPEEAFVPIYWGHWGPQAWYRGRSLVRDAQPPPELHGGRMVLAEGIYSKSYAPLAQMPLDPGLDALQIVLSTPGPLHAVLDDLGVGEAALLHAVRHTRPQPQRSALVLRRLFVRAQLRGRVTADRIAARPEARAALQALLALILDQPQLVSKSLPSAVTFPFWATVTALARHMRGSIMQAATNFVGDVMLYLARGAEVRQLVHTTVTQACKQRPQEPVMLIGHSLGGVIAYEYATDETLADRPAIDLVVTVGSQVALFAEYGILHGGRAPVADPASARYGYPPSTGGFRWVNFYDPDDFLSFPITGMFPQAADDDRACANGKVFPDSHTAYWDNPQLYTAIAEVYPLAHRQ